MDGEAAEEDSSTPPPRFFLSFSLSLFLPALQSLISLLLLVCLFPLPSQLAAVAAVISGDEGAATLGQVQAGARDPAQHVGTVLGASLEVSVQVDARTCTCSGEEPQSGEEKLEHRTAEEKMRSRRLRACTSRTG